MEQPLVVLERQDRVALVTINRPEKLNALNTGVIAALASLMEELNKDTHIRAIVLTGAGNKAFVAGADISEFSTFNAKEGYALAHQGQEQLFDRIALMDKPVIAAINGYALGGGLELAMACHFRYASTNAKMGLPEVTLGLIPGYGGTQRLPALVGSGLALEMMTSAQMIDAEQAYAAGLVNKVVALDELVPAACAVGKKIAQNAPGAVAHALRAVRAGAGAQPGTPGYEVEKKAFSACFGTSEFIEGVGAFLAKRTPDF